MKKPEWANFIATDKSGRTVWYENKPRKMTFDNGNVFFVSHYGMTCPLQGVTDMSVPSAGECWPLETIEYEQETDAVAGESTAIRTLKAALMHMEDRAKTYDNDQGERSMGKTVRAFNTVYNKDLTEEEGWIFMCLLKIVRTSQGDFREDNYEDLAAYAGLACEGAKSSK